VNLTRKRVRVADLLVAGCLLCLHASAARGQSARDLRGEVFYLGGRVVPGATVTLFSDDRVLTTKTNKDGEFAFASLPADARYLEVSFAGFFISSDPITDQTPEWLPVTLFPASWGQCEPTTIAGAQPSVYYEERSGKVQLTGTVGEHSGPLLAHAALTLIRYDLNTPLVMEQPTYKETVVSKTASNDKGEFEFRFADIKPGRYALRAAHDGYNNRTASFWIARENLTRLARINLDRAGEADSSCHR